MRSKPEASLVQGLSVTAVLLSLLSFSSTAQAFERQWHVGGGLGAVFPSRYYQISPALGLHAAYGISDVFDAKLELLGASLGLSSRESSPERSDRNLLYGATAGLAYKLDVLRIVPYVGVLVGYYWHTGEAPFQANFPRESPGAALALGVDYAITRQFSLGIDARLHTLLFSDSSDPGYLSVLLRAEKRWGW